MILTESQIKLLIDNYLQPNSNILATEHNEIETALNENLLNKQDFQMYFDAASKGAQYFFQTKVELNSFDTSELSLGNRALVLKDESQSNETTVYEWTGSSWTLVGELSSMGIDESDLVHKTGIEIISGLKTFTIIPPKLNATSHVEILTDYDIVDKKYVDDEIAAGAIAAQTVEVSINDTTPGRLFNKINNIDNKLNIYVADAGTNEKLIIDVDETQVSHDGLLNFVANEHVDHSTLSIVAGIGLSGGGTLTSSKTIDVNVNELTTIPDLSLTDEIIVSDVSNSNAVRKTTFTTIATLVNNSSSSTPSSKLAQYWFNTINEQVADYLYDNDANIDTKFLTRIDEEIGKTYEIIKANFFYSDPLAQEITNPQVHIVRNRGGVYTNMCTGVLTINPGDNDLTTILTTNSWQQGDYIELYVTTGTGTSAGSQIHGYFSWSINKL